MNEKEIPYNLKYEIAEFILPRLNEFYNHIVSGKNHSVPAGLSFEFGEAQEKWIDILKKIQIPFEYLLHADRFSHLSTEELDMQRETGLKLFSQYFESLWD